MKKIKRPKIGQYVLVSRWPDRDPRDPCSIGFVNGILEDHLGLTYRVNVSDRWYPFVFKISKDEGIEWLSTNKDQIK